MYRKIIKQLNSLLNIEESEDYLKPSENLVNNVRYFIGCLSRQSIPCPHDVYACPMGEIVIEWQCPSKIVIRVFFEESGKITEMVTYPNKNATFRVFKI